MKKLFAVLMIAGLFGFASCGSSEKKADETTATDTTAAAASTEAAAASTDQSVATTDSTAAAPATADSMKSK